MDTVNRTRHPIFCDMKQLSSVLFVVFLLICINKEKIECNPVNLNKFVSK